jgi:hydrogenase expression/formation protein HypE
VRGDVQSACDILGFDPLYVANEGRLAAFVPAHQAESALVILRQHPLGASAALIGSVTGQKLSAAPLQLRTAYGTERILMRLSGEQLPRIC